MFNVEQSFKNIHKPRGSYRIGKYWSKLIIFVPAKCLTKRGAHDDHGNLIIRLALVNRSKIETAGERVGGRGSLIKRQKKDVGLVECQFLEPVLSPNFP